MIFDLYDYQSDLKKSVADILFKQNLNSVIMSSPTGSGKTVTFADIARDVVKNGFKVMILVDRKELLEQAMKKLKTYGLFPSLITSGKRANSTSRCFIATVQTLVRRREFPKVDLIIIDEAHKQIFDKVIGDDFYKDTKKIGATATPYRTGKMNQLSDYYDEMVTSVSIASLIQKGFLVPAISYGAKMDTSKFGTRGGDFKTENMFNAFDQVGLYKGVVDKYQKFAKGTKAIVFNINVEHSKKVTQSFRAQGIISEHLDGSMSKYEREDILKRFSNGQIQVLNNVEVLTTGYDEWTIETVIVNRATKSVPLWLQMCGRGSRITPREYKDNPAYLQKHHFNLIDMGGNVHRLGFWEDEREYSLTHKTRTKEGVAPIKECPEDDRDRFGKYGCGAYIRASAKSCPYCDYLFPVKSKKELEADFMQLINSKSPIPEHLKDKSLKQMTIPELEEYKTALGYKHGWIISQLIARTSTRKDAYDILIKYAEHKKYKSPHHWAERQLDIRKK